MRREGLTKAEMICANRVIEPIVDCTLYTMYTIESIVVLIVSI